MTTDSTAATLKLSDTEQRELARRYKRDGDLQAKKTLIDVNIPYIKYYLNLFNLSKTQADEALLKGKETLIQALETYDPEKGRLKPYVRIRIEEAVEQVLQFLRSPVELPTNIPTCRRCIDRLRQQLEREPTRPEILARCKSCPRNLDALKQGLLYPQSLDEKGDANETGEETVSLSDTIPDSTELTPYEAAAQRSLCNRVSELLSDLDGFDQDVIRRKCGFDGQEIQTFRQIAAHYQRPLSTVHDSWRRGKKILKQLILADDLPRNNGNKPEPGKPEQKQISRGVTEITIYGPPALAVPLPESPKTELPQALKAEEASEPITRGAEESKTAPRRTRKKAATVADLAKNPDWDKITPIV